MSFFRTLGRVLLVPFQVIFEIIWGIIKLLLKAVWWLLKELLSFLSKGSFEEILWKVGGFLLAVAMIFRLFNQVDIAPVFVILSIVPFSILALIKVAKELMKEEKKKEKAN